MSSKIYYSSIPHLHSSTCTPQSSQIATSSSHIQYTNTFVQSSNHKYMSLHYAYSNINKMASGVALQQTTGFSPQVSCVLSFFLSLDEEMFRPPSSAKQKI
jgi:hypothetical protein